MRFKDRKVPKGSVNCTELCEFTAGRTGRDDVLCRSNCSHPMRSDLGPPPVEDGAFAFDDFNF